MIQVSYQQQPQDISASSISTMSYDEDEQHTTSSAPTTAQSSPYKSMIQQTHTQLPSAITDSFKKQELSPDLLQTDFYNSENNPIDHATNFRQSIVLSDSMDSIRYKDFQSFELNEIKTTSMTNSPSLADLANILDKKSGGNKRESGLRNMANKSVDTIVPIQEEDSESEQQEDEEEDEEPEEEELVQAAHPQDLIDTNTNMRIQSDSPNLIEFDDDEDTGSFQAKAANANNINYVQGTQDVDDIFKTPKIEQNSQTFSPQQTKIKSMLEDVLEDDETHVSIPKPNLEINESPEASIPEIVRTPIIDHNQIDPPRYALESPKFLQETPVIKQISQETPVIEQNSQNSFIDNNSDINSFHSNDNAPSSIKLLKNQNLKSPQYQKRSSSLPVLNTSNSTTKKEKRKSGFFSMFKSKKSSPANSVEETEPEPVKKLPKKLEKRSVSEQVRPTIKSSKSFQLSSSKSSTTLDQPASKPKVAKRSSSSTSLFGAFRRKSKLPDEFEEGFDVVSKPISPTNLTKKQSFTPTSRAKKDNDSDFDEFHEDFNKFKIESPVITRSKNSPVKSKLEPAIKAKKVEVEEEERFEFEPSAASLVSEKYESSIIAQGETLFPKSLNAQEVESIVSLERNRSVRSRNSINSNYPRRSLTDVISLKARESGMSVEIARETSVPDLSKSPQTSILKKKTSNGSFNNYFNDEFEPDDEELFNVEEFSQSLEFDNISYNHSAYQNDNADDQEEEEDLSKLVEFADFIDFGGDLDLGFDEYEQSQISSVHSSPKKLQKPLSAPPLYQPSPLVDQQSFEQMSMNSASPLNSPFLQQDSFVVESGPGSSKPGLSRPISMSFTGLKLQDFDNRSDYSQQVEESFETNKAPSVSTTTTTNSIINNGQHYKLTTSLLTGHSEDDGVKRVSFSSKIILYEAFNEDEYDRHPDIATCNQLTPATAQMIKNELNALKAEMPVHEDSRCYTHFF